MTAFPALIAVVFLLAHGVATQSCGCCPPTNRNRTCVEQPCIDSYNITFACTCGGLCYSPEYLLPRRILCELNGAGCPDDGTVNIYLVHRDDQCHYPVMSFLTDNGNTLEVHESCTFANCTGCSRIWHFPIGACVPFQSAFIRCADFPYNYLPSPSTSAETRQTNSWTFPPVFSVVTMVWYYAV